MAKTTAKSGKRSAVGKAGAGKANGRKAKIVAKVNANVAAKVKPVKKPAAKPAGKPAAPVTPVPGLTMAVTGFVAVAPPAPVAVKRELAAPREVARLLRYGELFGGQRIEIRWLPTPLPCPSGEFALVDPSAPKSQRSLDRKVPAGTFRCMLAIAVGGPKEKLAAVIFHCGRPPIARWTVAHFAGTKPPTDAAKLPSVTSTSGWFAVQDAATMAAVADPGVLPPPLVTPTAMAVERRAGHGVAFAFPVGPGAYTAYWGIDEHDKAVCLVIDFDVFTTKDWRAKPPR
ncbi:MAG: hypothetical protein KBG15_17035 [Kofleriaceae bacterium]|nr:hypothetical protein [Kofleriaceae bacterium]